jgi:hypothetical protein
MMNVKLNKLDRMQKELDRTQEALQLGMPKENIADFSSFSPKEQQDVINYLKLQKVGKIRL